MSQVAQDRYYTAQSPKVTVLATIAIPEITVQNTAALEEKPGSEEMVATLSEEIYAIPPTRGQERFWSLDQMIPGNPALNMPLMWKCTGPLDRELLREAFDRVVERHESLRTTFELVDGQLMQIIGAPWTVPIPIENLEGIPNAEFSPQAQQITNEHAAFRMNLRTGPLLVVRLLRFSPANHMLLVTLHHIICDGVSTGVLLRDVTAMYQALLERRPPILPDLPLQFGDFAVWQQEWRKTPAYVESLEFWRTSLGTNFSRLELRRDVVEAATSPRQSGEQAGDIETFLLGANLVEGVTEFCRRNFITSNVFFFSIFAVWLSRVSGQRDLLIGSPSANRMLQTEDLVGMFMNIQAMRVKVEENDTFKMLANKVQHWTVQAYENQNLPFEDLIYDQSFMSGPSSFELPVFFLYQKSFMVTHQIGDLKIEPLRSMSPGAAFEIMFAVVDRVGEGPRLQLEFNPLKFSSETIKLYLAQYVALVESCLLEPDALLTTIDRAKTVDRPDPQVSSPGPQVSSLRAQEIAERRTYADPIEFQLVELWQATLGIPFISVDDGFFSLGVSSLSALRLITKINRVYSTNLGLASLFSASTIRAIAVLVRERLSPNMHSSLVPVQPLGTKPPLFVVHGVRGNVLSFYGLVTHLGKDQPLYGIQAQALVEGEPALLRLEDMASYYIAEMRKLQPEGPYNLLGYSFGGIVAMEMAQQLRAAGQTVGLLGMLDSKSPDYMKALLRMRSAPSKSELDEQQPQGKLTQMSRSEKTEQLLDRIRMRLIRLSCQIATAIGVRKIPSFMKDPWSINYVANANYKPRVYEGRMTLFRAARQRMPNASADLDWGRFFTGGVDVRVLPGTHETLWSEQNVGAFAASLADSLQVGEASE